MTNMPSELRYQLDLGAATAKQIAHALGKSESRVRELLKIHVAEIHCEKNEHGVNIFRLRALMTPIVKMTDSLETSSGTAATPDAQDHNPRPLPPEVSMIEEFNQPDQGTEKPVDDVSEDEGTDTTHCPLCSSPATQERAGPAGSFLGGCLTCGECGKTYNEATGQELEVDEADKPKAKRTPLNPQYKIQEKVDAVTQAGGTLAFDRNTRRWVLSLGGVTQAFTAKEFSVEDATTILDYGPSDEGTEEEGGDEA